ncbi:MAG: type II toxin-antitoxin system VapC family toxin [Ignavibacteria bacterium]|nr:type II toxin-antitoxin system VapC family toxin [Ignavibacteria bacterium]
MNVVDSSGWIEYFANGSNADFFAPALENPDSLIVPAISIYEVFKKLLVTVGEKDAIRLVANLHQGTVAELDAPLALSAAKLSWEHSLPLAESIIYATALQYNATLWTQDVDFEKLKGVKFQPKIMKA